MNRLNPHMAQDLATFSLTPALAVSVSPGWRSCLPAVSALLMESACATFFTLLHLKHPKGTKPESSGPPLGWAGITQPREKMGQRGMWK